MKYFLSTSLLICLWTTSGAQIASLNKYSGSEHYLRPKTVSPVFRDLTPDAPRFSGKGQKILGISLTFGGLGIMTIGLLEIAAANSADPTTLTSDEKDLVRTEGIVLTVLGVAATTTGVIFWSKGAKNMGGRGSLLRDSSYQQQVSLNLKGAGAVLRFKF